TIPEEQSGKKVKCKKCDTVFVAGAGQQLTAAKEIAPSQLAEDEPRVEAVARRKRAEVREAAPRRRRDRYDDEDDDDYRPRRKSSGISGLALFLILGGVFGSLLIIIGSVIFVLWYWNSASTKPSQISVAEMQQHGGGADIPDVPDPGNNPAGEAAAKDNEIKHVDPPPPSPRELVFLSPTPKEA